MDVAILFEVLCVITIFTLMPIFNLILQITALIQHCFIPVLACVTNLHIFSLYHSQYTQKLMLNISNSTLMDFSQYTNTLKINLK